MSVAESLYSGSAAIGKVKATISLVVGIIITVCLSSAGSYIIVSTPSRSSETKASVVDSECKQFVRQMNNKSSTSTECTTGVNYNVDNKKYNNKVKTDGTLFKQGEKINIKYNPNNPNDISYNEMSNKKLGFILIGIGIILVILVVIYYYLITTYKPLAALEGASTTYDFAKNMFSRD